MTDKLNKLLDLLIKGIESGAEFASDNAGPLFREYYLYNIARDSVQLIGLLLLVAFLVWVFRKIKTFCDEMFTPIAYVITVILLTGAVCCLFGISSDLIGGLVAPKIYTIKAIKHDLTGTCK